jgi:sodium/potassium/calcium exchanger 6
MIVVSVVVGSIALIRPFHVPRFPFLRDTIFFTAAVLCLVMVLKDGHLSLYESGGMVALYIAYVAVVIGSTYWNKPKPETTPATPEVRPSLSTRPSLYRINTNPDEDEFARKANFSLLSAIEFRDVVNSLRTPNRSPITLTEREDYFGAVLGHRRAISTPHEWPQFSPAAALGASVNVASSLTPTVINGRRRSASYVPKLSPLPTIALTDPSGQEAAPTQPSTPSESRFRIRHHTRAILWTIFPSLRDFRHKSIVGMFMAIVSVPALLLLTITLPVVDDASGDAGISLPVGQDEPLDEETGRVTPQIGEELHHLAEDGFHIHPEHEEGGGIGCFSKELTAAQVFFGPVVCVYLIFSEFETGLDLR